MKSRKRYSVLNALWGFGGQLLNIILKFACRTVFIKTLGTTYLGINGLFSDILMMLSLAELGFDTAITYRLYKPVAEQDNGQVIAFVKLFKKIYSVVGVVIFVAGLVFIPLLKYIIADYDKLGALGIDAVLIFLLYLIQNISSYFFGAYKAIVLRVHQEQYLLDITAIGVNFISCVTQIAILLITKDFIYYIWVLTIFVVLQNIVNGIVAKKTYPQYFKKTEFKLTKNDIKDLFKDCSALFVYKINNVVMKATDNIVLSSMIGLSIVGLYSNYLLVYVAIVGILQKLLNAVKDSLGNLFVSNNDEKKYFFFEVMNFVVILLYGSIGLSFALGINDFIYLWIGEEYVISQPFPVLIGIELLLTGLKQNLAQIRHVSGIFRQMWYRPIIGSLINIILSVVFAKIYGIAGVIMGTIAAAIFANLSIDPILIHKYSFNNFKTARYYYTKNVIFIAVLIVSGILNYYLTESIFCEHSWLNLIMKTCWLMISIPMFFFIIFHSKKESQYLIEQFYHILPTKVKHIVKY